MQVLFLFGSYFGLYLRGNGSGSTRYYKGVNADTLPVDTWTQAPCISRGRP